MQTSIRPTSPSIALNVGPTTNEAGPSSAMAVPASQDEMSSRPSDAAALEEIETSTCSDTGAHVQDDMSDISSCDGSIGDAIAKESNTSQPRMDTPSRIDEDVRVLVASTPP